VAPEDLDLIVLTHLDFDHAGGLLRGEWPDRLELVYPGVPVAVPEAAVAWARDADADAELNMGSRLVDVLERERALRTLGDGAELAPSIRFRASPGHRAGHCCVEIRGDDPLVHLADVLHHEVHAEHPEWDSQADAEPELALATRRSWLAALAASGTRCVISHVAGPGALRIERAGDAFRFLPA
jgi:glyoxylase-like metal-dependent hydrolase (beta-lactamase superfamily II)